jgi:hypothetical protein
LTTFDTVTLTLRGMWAICSLSFSVAAVPRRGKLLTAKVVVAVVAVAVVAFAAVAKRAEINRVQLLVAKRAKSIRSRRMMLLAKMAVSQRANRTAE